MKKRLLFLVLLCCFLGFSQHNQTLFYKKGVTMPVIHLVNFNHQLVTPISNFQKQIKNSIDVGILFSPTYTPNSINIHFSFVDSALLKNNEYKIELYGNVLEIKANSVVNFNKATTHFVNNMLQSNKDHSIVYLQNINISEKITHQDFEYREVYFTQNFDKNTRSLLNTQHLELEWGLWGHNIIKWVKKENTTDKIFALVNGERNNNQLCFSSSELQHIIHQNIEKLSTEDSSLKRFIIAPYDNNLVCQCNLCIAKGNTKTNATPAVYSLIEQMANTYPTKTFWSLGYVTTSTPPLKPLPQNVGVLLSSIDSQESQPLKNTAKGEQFLKEIELWNAKIENVYVWDYVVNFDNYMDFYPIFNSTKENLKSYKNNGVTGVFMQGSGYDYSILEEIKHYVLASLLNNSNSSVNDLILEAAQKYYPEISNEVYEFLTFIEDQSLKGGFKQNIYSGISNAQKRYLTLHKLQELEEAIHKVPTNIKLQKLKAGILFLELELHRINGLNSNGYATLNNHVIRINPNIKSKLIALESLIKTTELNFINEKKETFSDYLNQWDQLLYKINNNATFYPVTMTTKTQLDVDYNNIKILNNGAYGFTDYNNNWLIFSGTELNIDVMNKNDIEINKIEFSFLSDIKHKIYLPIKIQITDANNVVIKEIEVANKQNNSEKRIESISLDIPIQKNQLYTIKFINSYKSIAIDEIRFLNHE